MRRGARITVPYTLCLFAAFLFVIFVVGAAIGGMAYRDTVLARPVLAHRVLSEALEESNQQLKSHFEPSLAQLRLAQRWVVQGILRPDAMARWPALLLPPLIGHEEIQALAFLSEEGLQWQAVRAEGGWAGYRRAQEDLEGSLMVAHWDGLGRPKAHGPAPPPALGSVRYNAALQSLSRGGSESADAVAVIPEPGEDGGSGVGLVMSVGSALGTPGIVVLTVASPVLKQAFSAEATDVVVQFDPGALRLSQLVQSQMKALLTTQAVPDQSNLALRTLFALPDASSESRWYAARPYHLGKDFTWWSVASVSQAMLPAPILPLKKYAIIGLFVGLLTSILIAFVLGRKVSVPLAHIARRAKNIHAIEEHYLPWPESPFTEVNALTNALEDLYESAVEHLDYHEAPLIVWAQEEALSGDDGIIDAEPVKRHVNLRAHADADNVPDESGSSAVINVHSEAAMPVVPAAQMQVLHGARKEVRRLQGQLAGAYEELRTADAHFQQSETRLKRQRSALRKLDKQLRNDSVVSIATLATIREALGARSVSLWRPTSGKNGAFTVRFSTDSRPDTTPILLGIALRAALLEEFVISTRDLHGDPRLGDLKEHPQWKDHRCALLIAPLKFRGRLLGFVVVEQSSGNGAWKPDEEAFVANCAVQCTMVLGYKRQSSVVQVNVSAVEPKNGNGRVVEQEREEGLLHWETDLAGCIKSLRGDVAGIYGYTPEALLGQPLTFLSSREQGERDLAKLSQVLSGRLCTGHETRHLASDGSAIALTVQAEVHRDATGRIIGVRGTAALLVVSTA